MAYLRKPAAGTPEEAELAADFNAWIASEPEILRVMGASPCSPRPNHGPSNSPNLVRSVSKQFLISLRDCLQPQAGRSRNLPSWMRPEKPQAFVRFTVIAPLRDLVNTVPEAQGGN